MILSILIYTQVSSEFRDIVVAENTAILNLTVAHVEEKIGTDIANAKTFADRPLLIEAFKNNDSKKIEDHFKNFIENSRSIERIIAFTPHGTGIIAYPESPELSGKDLSDRDWYKGVSRNWTPYVSDFFLRLAAPKRYLFAIAVPVKEPSGKVAGIILLHPKEDYFSHELSETRMGKSFVYIVDKNGHLVYHPNYNIDRVIDFSGTEPVKEIQKGLSGVERGNDPITNEAVVSAFKPMQWGWGVIMQRPEKGVMRPIRNTLAALVIFTAIALVIGVIISFSGMDLLYSIRSLSVRLSEREKAEREVNERLKTELAERKRAEDNLARTLIDLERSNKELEQFAYVASHDLQEPLRKVASFTELLERRYKEQMGPDADRYIGYIVDGAKRMSMLITDLLTLSRIGTSTVKFALTDCNEVLNRTLNDLQYRIRESGAEITRDKLPVIMADESQIGLLFQNLISNAIKFRRDEPPRVHFSAKRAEDGWIFSVSDNGIGIEPEFYDRIFVMFQRLHSKSEYPGTGIGLAICKKIIERHGGRIWVESEFGKGTTFYFRIPDTKKEVYES